MSKRKLSEIPLILDGKFFVVVKSEDGNVTAKCVTCDAEIKGKMRPTSNFTTHLQLRHREKLEEYKKFVEEKSHPKQGKLNFPIVSTHSTNQQRLIMNYIVQTMSPLSTVEKPSFINLVKGLNPDATVLARNTLVNRIHSEHKIMKEKLTDSLHNKAWVCVTTDIWSARHRSFLGVTVHWLEKDFTRMSYVLALQRFPGHHTGDEIARRLDSLFKSYMISDKITYVITDNGSNFVKAFQAYGLELETEVLEDEEDVMDSAVAFELLDDFEISYKLPRHYRCASHTLSLISTTDMDKELDKRVIKKDGSNGSITCKNVLRSTFAKCTAVWNKAARSVIVNEGITTVTGKVIVTPAKTRWNSMYDSIKFLLDHFELLDEVFKVATVEKLKPHKKDFLRAYSDALQPIVWALNKLQGENRCYFGYIAPVFLRLEEKLKIQTERDNIFTCYIATALLASLKARYLHILELDEQRAKDEIISAICLPTLKLSWLPASALERIKTCFIREVKKFQGETSAIPPSKPKSNIVDNDDDLLDMTATANLSSSQSSDEVELQCIKYFQEEGTDISVLDCYPTIKSLSIKLNTALPSSAPAERLFSFGGMVLCPKRGRLSDEHFEQLVLLKLNKFN